MDNAPRLAILSLNPSEPASRTAEECERHAKWVSYLALKQYNQMKGFLVSREPQEQMDQWETSRVAHLRSLPDVRYLPLEWCKYGFLNYEDNQLSGILTNVTEVHAAFLEASESLHRRKGKNPDLKDSPMLD